MAEVYIGMDPGVRGGIAVLWEPGTEQGWVKLHPLAGMPDNMVSVLLLQYTRANKGPVLSALEDVTGHFGKDRPGSRLIELAASYGALRALATVSLGRLPLLVRPVDWQRALGVPSRDKKRGETDAQHKAKLKALAVATYPNVKGLTLQTCDALLIAHYLYLKTMGGLPKRPVRAWKSSRKLEKGA